MEYDKDDAWLFGPEHTSNKTEGWAMVCWLICLVFVFALLGCDLEAAEHTAQAEKEAQEQKQTVMAWWYSETYQPFKASQANVTITVCQQSDSTIHWYCWGGAK